MWYSVLVYEVGGWKLPFSPRPSTIHHQPSASCMVTSIYSRMVTSIYGRVHQISWGLFSHSALVIFQLAFSSHFQFQLALSFHFPSTYWHLITLKQQEPTMKSLSCHYLLWIDMTLVFLSVHSNMFSWIGALHLCEHYQYLTLMTLSLRLNTESDSFLQEAES